MSDLIPTSPSTTLKRLRDTAGNTSVPPPHAFKQPSDAPSLQQLEAILQNDPANFQAWFHKGLRHKQQHQSQLALQCFNQALTINPSDEATLIECGNVLFELEQFEFALAHHEFALQLNPASLPALHSKCLALNRLGRHQEALHSADQMLTYSPTFVPALLCQGSLLHTLGHHQEALASYQQVLQLGQADALLYLNLANLFLDMLALDLASDCYQQALLLEPDNPTLHWNMALFQLLIGDYAQGWRLYESGKNAPHLPRGRRRDCAQPMWTGEQSLDGKRILLYAEQGLGDTIQFVRYAQLVADLGAQVIIEAPASLLPLLGSLGPQFELITAGTAYQAYDYHCSLMSLPFVFNTELQTIPQHTPYLFAAPDKVSSIQIADPEKLRVGLVWSGSTTHQKDRYRSIPLAQFADLLTLDASFHCLQTEVRDTDLACLAEFPQISLHQATLHDFTDTAALIATLDLVISVDTSVAHLAGAMHKPVWILLPNPPDFRWMLTREDSPWYPSARLFRAQAQVRAQAQDWTTVMASVKQALAEKIKEKSKH
ncbi:tetratricopeptide repeat protein [Methylophilus sp. 3sh_L]|uniref:tetratricopeptide repeat protein n=1 Tax=Methylophilus sp. 3sh_L TaxID=3377114 RepID=UPI00398F7FA4